MQNIQDVFNRIQETKKEQRHIRAVYKDLLESSTEYRELLEKIQVLKERKKQLETEARAELGKDADRIEVLKRDVKQDQEMLSDIALSTLMQGQTIQVIDQDNNEYEPLFTVKFKKANIVQQQVEQ
jgi:hypothetical protein